MQGCLLACELPPEGFFYCPYMILYNIPMYWRIFRHDEEQGKTYLSILEGIVDSWRTSILLTGAYLSYGRGGKSSWIIVQAA